MSKKQAGERKRTVAIVIGPLTEHQLRLYSKACTKDGVEVLLTDTDLIGSMVTSAVHRWGKQLGVPMPEGLSTHYD